MCAGEKKTASEAFHYEKQKRSPRLRSYDSSTRVRAFMFYNRYRHVLAPGNAAHARDVASWT